MTTENIFLALQMVDKFHESFQMKTRKRIDTARFFETYEPDEENFANIKKHLINLTNKS
jgi:hypothetical protein|tara:strand:+ start:587 stop:763 length:177 start_codon:yes stop_codon:yes gene_type:complete